MIIAKKFFLSKDSRKLLTYYIIYCILFLIIYLAFISTVSFFHFLLDHEMGIIENWINTNFWNILTLSKVITAYIILKSIMLNSYDNQGLRSFVSSSIKVPSKKCLVSILYIGLFLYALMNQFSAGLIAEETPFNTQLGLSSYIGSSLFFFIDALVILFLFKRGEFNRRQCFYLNLIIPFLFYGTTKFTLPYVDKHTLFVFLHIIALNIFILENKDHLTGIFLYAFFVIGPLALFLGVDLVWDNSYAFYAIPKTVPILGIFLIWLSGLFYYIYTKQITQVVD